MRASCGTSPDLFRLTCPKAWASRAVQRQYLITMITVITPLVFKIYIINKYRMSESQCAMRKDVVEELICNIQQRSNSIPSLIAFISSLKMENTASLENLAFMNFLKGLHTNKTLFWKECGGFPIAKLW